MITQAQQEFRKSRIGGSDIAAIRGNSKYSGAAQVQQRIQGVAESRGYQQKYNPCFEFGNRLESLIADVFAENHPEYLVMSVEDAYYSGVLEKLPGFKGVVHVLEDGSVSITHEEYDYMVLNLDYLLISKRNQLDWGVLEIKTASEYVSEDWGLSGTDQVPYYYNDQPLYYAGGIGACFMRVAVMIGLRDYREYHLPFDPDGYEQILNDVVNFYANHIVFGKPAHDVVDAVNKNYLVNRETVVADQRALDALMQRKALDEKLKPLQKAREKADSVVKALLGDAEMLVDDAGQVLFQVSEKESMTLDQDALARHLPDVFKAFCKLTPKRRTSTGDAYRDLAVTEVARNKASRLASAA